MIGTAQEFIERNGGRTERYQEILAQIMFLTPTVGETLQAIYNSDMSEPEKIAAAFVFGTLNTQSAIADILGIPMELLHELIKSQHTSEE